MKFYLPTLKHLVMQLAKLQIYTLNLTTTFWHCKKKSHYFWTGVYMSVNTKNDFDWSLQWRPNEPDGVSNHQFHGCLLNRYSGADQRKHQSSASLAFVWGIHRWPVNSPHKWPVTRKMFPFDDVIVKWIFFNENLWISIEISLKFVPEGRINNIPPLVQIMAWRCPGDKPLSEPMLVRLPTYICVTRPQWVNSEGR